ncbi:hypothetical protein K8R78_05425 [bacterium]|nr:hypothetical protein [bacterium]
MQITHKAFLELLSRLRRRCPVRVCVLEESPGARLLHRLLLPLGISFLSFAAFTWAGTIYLSRRLFNTAGGYKVLRHEAVHLLDQHRLGLLPFIIGYLLLLPFGLTIRAYFEWRGYRETLRAWWEDSPPKARRRGERLVGQFTSRRYGFMWLPAGMVRRWVERELARIEQTDGRACPGLELLSPPTLLRQSRPPRPHHLIR